MTPGSFSGEIPVVGGRGTESTDLSPQGTWTSVATSCEGGSHLRVLAPPAWLKEHQMAKPQAVLMDCTAIPPEDTRGQEALTQKLRLDF